MCMYYIFFNMHLLLRMNEDNQKKTIKLSRFFNDNIQLIAGTCTKCYQEQEVKIVGVNQVFLNQMEKRKNCVINVERIASEREFKGSTKFKSGTKFEGEVKLEEKFDKKIKKEVQFKEEINIEGGTNLKERDVNELSFQEEVNNTKEETNFKAKKLKKEIKHVEKVHIGEGTNIKEEIKLEQKVNFKDQHFKMTENEYFKVITKVEKTNFENKTNFRGIEDLKNIPNYEENAYAESKFKRSEKSKNGKKNRKDKSIQNKKQICKKKQNRKKEKSQENVENQSNEDIQNNNNTKINEKYRNNQNQNKLKFHKLKQHTSITQIWTPKWIPPKSPHNLIEEELYEDPWALLVATIFLNKTSCMSARPYIKKFLEDHPAPQHVLNKNSQDLEAYFVNIGLKKRRSQQVWKMSYDFLFKNWNNVKELHGIGKYGEDAFRLFCLGDENVEPKDRFLRIYRDWLRMKQKEEKRNTGCNVWKEEKNSIDYQWEWEKRSVDCIWEEEKKSVDCEGEVENMNVECQEKEEKKIDDNHGKEERNVDFQGMEEES